MSRYKEFDGSWTEACLISSLLRGIHSSPNDHARALSCNFGCEAYTPYPGHACALSSNFELRFSAAGFLLRRQKS
jgi:hypothetical protein